MEMMSGNTIRLCSPVVVERAVGGWLAVSDDLAPIAIGIVGRTAEEARERFAWALREWAALVDRQPPEQKVLASDT